jgi:hypothetical protein
MNGHLILATMVLISAAACGSDSSTDQTGSAAPPDGTDPAVTQPSETTPPTEPSVAITPDSEPSPSVEEVAVPWPRPRGYHEAIYDAADDSVLVVGGCTGPQCSATNEIWSFDHQNSTWTEHSRVDFMSPAGGPVAYDGESGRIIALEVVFGDVDGGSIGTWVYDRADDTWTEMEAEPQARLGVGARMVYDSQSDRLIAFGGQGFGDETVEWTPGTWAYDDNTNTWEEMKPALEPGGLNYFAFTYDEESDRAVLFGLQDGGATLMWAYDYDSDSWEELDRTGGPNHASVYTRSFYHPGTDRIVFFGGWGPVETERDMQTLNQVWAYDLNSNTWEEKEPNGLSGPIAWHTLTYVDSIDRALAFGGGGSYYGYTGNRLFSYNPVNDGWTEILQT